MRQVGTPGAPGRRKVSWEFVNLRDIFFQSRNPGPRKVISVRSGVVSIHLEATGSVFMTGRAVVLQARITLACSGCLPTEQTQHLRITP
jgi:hypothetical protein